MSIEELLNSLSSDEINDLNEKDMKEAKRQLNSFTENYKKWKCYICWKDLSYFSENFPCIHTILLAWDIKKGLYRKLLSWVVKKWSYHNISAMCRRAANTEQHWNINDLIEEKKSEKFFEYTIKYKEKEFTFSCSNSDLVGHKNSTNANFPHRHLQVRYKWFPYLNFNDDHIKFDKYDLFMFNAQKTGRFLGWWWYGWAWPQEHLDIIDEAVKSWIDPSKYLKSSKNWTWDIRVQTFISAKEWEFIPWDLLESVMRESETTWKTMNYIVKEKYWNKYSIKTYFTPPDDIPDIAERNNPRKKS